MERFFDTLRDRRGDIRFRDLLVRRADLRRDCRFDVNRFRDGRLERFRDERLERFRDGRLERNLLVRRNLRLRDAFLDLAIYCCGLIYKNHLFRREILKINW